MAHNSGSPVWLRNKRQQSVSLIEVNHEANQTLRSDRFVLSVESGTLHKEPPAQTNSFPGVVDLGGEYFAPL